MKKLLFFIAVFSAGNLLAQEFDSRLLDVYPIKELQHLQKTDPQRIAYLTFFLDNGYYLIEQAPLKGKDDSFYKISDLKIIAKQNQEKFDLANFNPYNFNPLAYNFKRSRVSKTYYRVDGTDKIIVFLSENELAQKFNAQK